MTRQSKYTQLSILKQTHSTNFLSLLKTYHVFDEPTLDIDPAIVDRLNVILSTIFNKSNNLTQKDQDNTFVWIDWHLKRSLMTTNTAVQTYYLNLLFDNGYLTKIESTAQTKFKKSYLYVQLTDKAIARLTDEYANPHPTYSKITRAYINYYLNVIGEYRMKLWTVTHPFYIELPDQDTFMTEWMTEFDKYSITHTDSTIEDYRDQGLCTFNNIKKYNELSPISKLHTMSIDQFGKRFHTFFTRIPKRLRSIIKHPDIKSGLVEIDLAQSQPTLLGQILFNQMGENAFTSEIKSTNTNKTRIYNSMTTDTIDYDSAKTLFMKSIFGNKIDPIVFAKFGQTVIDNLTQYKLNCADTYYRQLCTNASKYKLRNALCSIIQRLESQLMKQIYTAIDKELSIAYYTIHDCIAVEPQYVDQVIEIANRVAGEFMPDVCPRFCADIDDSEIVSEDSEIVNEVVSEVVNESVSVSEVPSDLDSLIDDSLTPVIRRPITCRSSIKIATEVPDDLFDLVC